MTGRTAPAAQTQYQEIVQHVNQELAKLPDGFALSFPPPAIPGVGTSGGFTFVLEDRAGKDVQFLADNLQKFMAAASKRPEIAPGMVSTFLPSVPQQFLEVDREKALKQGVPLNDVYRTIQAYMGGLFVNYFNRFGRQWQVYVEAEGEYRKNLDNVGQFYVRNCAGRDGAALGADQVRIAPGPGVHHALQPVPLGADHRRRRARIQLGAGDEGAGRDLRPNHAARDGLRLHGHVVSGEEGAGRRAHLGDLRVLAAVRVPDSGGAV